MPWSFVIPLLVSAILPVGLAGDTYNQGYWTPSTSTTSDTWWTPTTTCYTSYYTPTSTWTTVWTQNEVIVTVTSYIPCPVTSTVVYYTQTCQQCCYGCQQTATQPAIGVTTVTTYTTVTPGLTETNQGQVVTTTSNGYVIIYTTTTAAANAQATVSIYEVTSNMAATTTAATTLGYFPWLSAACLALFTCLIIAL